MGARSESWGSCVVAWKGVRDPPGLLDAHRCVLLLMTQLLLSLWQQRGRCRLAGSHCVHLSWSTEFGAAVMLGYVALRAVGQHTVSFSGEKGRWQGLSRDVCNAVGKGGCLCHRGV